MDDVPDTAQHFIECDTESCRNFSKFYCNKCHQPICDDCREAHLKGKKQHEIVLYQKRKRKLPSEKCRIHPPNDVDIYCTFCQDPLCSTCFAQDHSGHAVIDLGTIYNDILQQCREKITEIWNTVIPGAMNDVESMRQNAVKEITELRISMKKRADKLNKVVNSLLIDNNKNLDEIEKSVLNDMNEHHKKTEDYKKNLEKIIEEYDNKLSSVKHTELMKFHLDFSLATLKIPKKAEPKLPILKLGTLNKKEIAKQFGKIEKQSSEKLKISSVTKISEVTIKKYNFHLSLLPPNILWTSDNLGSLSQFDMKGNIIQKISTNLWNIRGYHTVTTEGELLYTDCSENIVYRVNSEKSIDRLVQTGNSEPGAIYSSPINGHILVGMETKSAQKITRYNREGRKLQDIQRDDKGQTIYKSVNFITENINGDICASDFMVKKLVVVTASGEYRFSYSGHHSQSGFRPSGVCTDVVGHILVCNSYFAITMNENCTSVHLLDINGQFLSLLLTPEQCPLYISALCIDDQHNFWVGGLDSSTVSVYKYLQNSKI